LGAVRDLLEALTDPAEDDEELTEADLSALRLSSEYFRQGGPGIPFEQVVAECGLTLIEVTSAQTCL